MAHAFRRPIRMPVRPLTVTRRRVSRGRWAMADSGAGPFEWGRLDQPNHVVRSDVLLPPLNASLQDAALRYRWSDGDDASLDNRDAPAAAAPGRRLLSADVEVNGISAADLEAYYNEV